MLKAVESLPIRAGLVKCALALALWATPAQAQEQVVCGPAEALREFLESHGLTKTTAAPMTDGDMLEAWESETRIAITIFIHGKEPTRCLVRTMGVNRPGRGA